MTRGPVPPHERAWRHPSELAAPPHEPTSRVGYMLIASTATVGLLLVGILALSMTPDRLGAPEQSFVGSTEVVLTTSRAFGAEPSTNGAPHSAADSVLRAVETLLTVAATQPNQLAPGIPIDPTGPAASVSTLVAPATTSVPPAGMTPTDPTESPQPSTPIPATGATGPASAEPVETAHESAFTTPADPASSFPVDELEPDLAGNLAFVLTESSEPPVVEPEDSTSSSTSSGPGQSTTTTSTATTSTTSSSSTTTVAATSTTLGFQIKQLGG